MNDCIFKIIIPAFNAEKTIGRTLDSILNQTCKSFHIFIYDDMSTDSTWKILCEYQSKYNDCITTVRLNGKLYAGGIRNMGTQLEFKSEYTWFIDADDLIADNTILKQLNDEINSTHKKMYTFDCKQFRFNKMCHNAPWLRIVKSEYVSSDFYNGKYLEDVTQFYYQFQCIADDDIKHLPIRCISYSGSHNNFKSNDKYIHLKNVLEAVKCKLTKQWLIERMNNDIKMVEDHGIKVER